MSFPLSACNSHLCTSEETSVKNTKGVHLVKLSGIVFYRSTSIHTGDLSQSTFVITLSSLFICDLFSDLKGLNTLVVMAADI